MFTKVERCEKIIQFGEGGFLRGFDRSFFLFRQAAGEKEHERRKQKEQKNIFFHLRRPPFLRR